MSTAVAPRSQTNMASKIESALDRNTAGGIALSQKNGLVIASMGEAMEFAKLMALSGSMIPKHLRNNPGGCLGICIQAYEWQINPYALAQKSYEVNDRTCYEASLYHAIVCRRAPITGRVQMEYTGEAKTRRCRVFAVLADGTGTVEYWSPVFDSIKPKNSPLWLNDPDQQLFYFSVRAFTRRHFPDVMMGIYTVDEMMDSGEITVTATRPTVGIEALTSPKLVVATQVTTEDVASVTASESEQNGEPFTLSNEPPQDQSYEGRIRRATTANELDFIDCDLRDDPQLDQPEQKRLMELSAQQRKVLTQK